MFAKRDQGGPFEQEPDESGMSRTGPCYLPRPITRRNIAHPIAGRTARHTDTPPTTPMMPIAIGSCTLPEEYHATRESLLTR